MEGVGDIPVSVLGATAPKVSPQSVSYRDTEAIMEPYSYLLQVPGKRIRSRLIDAFDKWLCIPSDVKQEVKRIVAMLHTASLMIDDIEDNSHLRRGIPAAHCVYGVPGTINCANYVYFLALQRCMQLGRPAAVNGFLAEMVKLHEGQGFDIFWRDNGHCPTEEEYKSMVLDKTGGLFRLAVSIMQAFSDDDTDYTPLVNQLGLFFQIQDDYMNLHSLEYTKNKSFCEDLTEGKYSFPIIHAINKNPNDHRLPNILKLKTSDVNIKKYAVSYMEACGSFAYTREVLFKLQRETLDAIEALGGNEDIVAIVNFLASRIDRNKSELAPRASASPVSEPQAPHDADHDTCSSDSSSEEVPLRAAFTLSTENYDE